MKQLSLKKYGWKCVLGAEAVYAVCILGGFLPLRSARGIELHHAFFEILPGFTWISFSSFIWFGCIIQASLRMENNFFDILYVWNLTIR